MRPVFFKLTLWNDPQKGAKRPAEWGACHGANRHAHGSQRAASVAEGALAGTHRIDPLQCARGIRRRRRPWISIVRGGYHRVTDLTSGRSDYGASVGILASQLLRHCHWLIHKVEPASLTN